MPQTYPRHVPNDAPDMPQVMPRHAPDDAADAADDAPDDAPDIPHIKCPVYAGLNAQKHWDGMEISENRLPHTATDWLTCFCICRIKWPKALGYRWKSLLAHLL